MTEDRKHTFSSVFYLIYYTFSSDLFPFDCTDYAAWTGFIPAEPYMNCAKIQPSTRSLCTMFPEEIMILSIRR